METELGDPILSCCFGRGEKGKGGVRKGEEKKLNIFFGGVKSSDNSFAELEGTGLE